MYDLTTTNVDLLADSSNHRAMFLEYSRNIPQISVSKIFQGYPQHIVRFYENVLMKLKISKNCFVGYPVNFLILAISSLEMFSSYRYLTAGKDLKLAQHYYQYITLLLSIFSFKYLVYQCVRASKNLCNCIHVTVFFNCSYCGSTSLPTRIIKYFTHWAFTFSKSTIETLEQDVKSVQS